MTVSRGPEAGSLATRAIDRLSPRELTWFPTYRTAAEGCQHCDELAFSRCLGCGGPRCLEHTVVHGAHCPDCQLALQARLGAIRAWPWRLLGAMFALPLFPVITGPLQAGWRHRMWAWGALPTGLALFDAAVITALCAAGLGSAFVLLRRRHAYSRFQIG